MWKRDLRPNRHVRPHASLLPPTDTHSERVDVADTPRDLVHVHLGVHDREELVRLRVRAESAVDRLGNVVHHQVQVHLVRLKETNQQRGNTTDGTQPTHDSNRACVKVVWMSQACIVRSHADASLKCCFSRACRACPTHLLSLAVEAVLERDDIAVVHHAEDLKLAVLEFRVLRKTTVEGGTGRATRVRGKPTRESEEAPNKSTRPYQSCTSAQCLVRLVHECVFSSVGEGCPSAARPPSAGFSCPSVVRTWSTFLMATVSPVSMTVAWYTTPKLPFPMTRSAAYRTAPISFFLVGGAVEPTPDDDAEEPLEPCSSFIVFSFSLISPC